MFITRIQVVNKIIVKFKFNNFKNLLSNFICINFIYLNVGEYPICEGGNESRFGIDNSKLNSISIEQF